MIEESNTIIRIIASVSEKPISSGPNEIISELLNFTIPRRITIKQIKLIPKSLFVISGGFVEICPYVNVSIYLTPNCYCNPLQT